MSKNIVKRILKPRPYPDGLCRSTVHYSDGTVKKTTTARAIMEVHLNRKLTNDEYVMYRDGDPKNLSYKNLELVSRKEHFKRINSRSIEKSDGRSKVHPNLNLSYFEKIDTQEKAYWLGFLAADGCVKENYVIQFGLKISDIETVRNFAISIGANPEKIKIIKTKASKDSDKIYEAAYLAIHNKIFYTNLVNCGIVPRKSKIIRIPEFIKHDEQKLYAYALGYFDGNGFLSKRNKKPSGTICSGSIGFLQDLKETLNINYEIRNSKTCYAINISAEILKKMYDSYENSMPRKRRIVET